MTTQKPPASEKHRQEQKQREEALAKQLRENLRRRKAAEAKGGTA